MSILFLTLKTFSSTGGVEKVGRVAGKALYDYGLAHNEEVAVYSMYDDAESETEPYISKKLFTGFSGNKSSFVSKSLRQGRKSRVVVLAHVKLLIAGYLIKLFSRKTQLILVAHGKEVWQPLSYLQKKMLRSCDLILPVSRFTKERMIDLYKIPAGKFRVLNNCLDPFLPLPADEARRFSWREKYGIERDAVLLMTLSRLTIHEKNKGYDKILVAIKELLPAFSAPAISFCGKI